MTPENKRSLFNDASITEDTFAALDRLERDMLAAHLLIGLLVMKLDGKIELKVDDAADRLQHKRLIQTFDMQTGTVLLEMLDKSPTPQEIKQ